MGIQNLLWTGRALDRAKLRAAQADEELTPKRQRWALMSNDFSPSFRRWAYSLAAVLGLAGCSTPTQVGRARAQPAHVSVVNLTDYSWRVDLAAADGSRHFTAQLAPRRSADLEIPGGAYQIDQSILNATDRPHAPRHFATELVAGKTYHWPLATLQSDADEDRAEPSPRG